jgi:hypothetical protein
MQAFQRRFGGPSSTRSGVGRYPDSRRPFWGNHMSVATAGTPVSWKLVEGGWDVLARDGVKVGEVAAVVGDADADLFHGLAVRLLGAPEVRLVDPDQIAGLVEGTVTLSLTGEQAAALPPYEPPQPQVVVTSEPASLLDRVRTWLGGGIRR